MFLGSSDYLGWLGCLTGWFWVDGTFARGRGVVNHDGEKVGGLCVILPTRPRVTLQLAPHMPDTTNRVLHRCEVAKDMRIEVRSARWMYLDGYILMWRLRIDECPHREDVILELNG